MIIYRHKDKYSISAMCRFFKVSRSGYYGYVSRMDMPAKDLPLAEKTRMSRKGNPYDNALAENFFSILKTECIYRSTLQTYEDARLLINEYIIFTITKEYN